MIYRETHTINYTVVSNSLINNKLPSDAKNVLTWLLSKPKNWKLIKIVIAEALGLSKHKVQQAITVLRNMGYLCFYRHKDGSGHWDVYETPRSQHQPQTRVVKPSSEIPTKAFQTDLTNTDTQKILKTTTDSKVIPKAPVTDEPIVVVSFEKIEQPTDTTTTPDPVILEQIKTLPLQPKEKKIAERTLSNLPLSEVKAILCVYTSALVKGNVINKIGYLIGLKKASQNGTLTIPEEKKELSIEERIERQKRQRKEEYERQRITNEQWVEMMAKRGIIVTI